MFFASALLLLSACSDDDPRFGGAGAIKNVKVFDTPAPTATEGGAGLSPRQLFGVVWNALKAPCGRCHAPPGSSGAPLFFGADEETSYASFKTRNYDKEGGKPAASTFGLTERGLHTGRALTDEEKLLIANWRAAEKTSDAGAPSDAGGGGG